MSWESGSFSGFGWVSGSEDERNSSSSDSARSDDRVRRGSFSDDQTIIVEREALLAFVQMRTQEANAEALAETFDGLSRIARQVWIDRFVREEALVREARRLGLDRDDELIRRRLVQKMEFLAEGIVDADVLLGDEEVEAIYRERVEEYREPAILSFSHVFVRAGKPDAAEPLAARALAESLLAALNDGAVSDRDAGALGDRFLYNRRYVDRTYDEVKSHFGEEAAEAMLSLSVDANGWQGPIRSEHGWHLVLLTEQTPSRLPSIEEIDPVLRRDLTRERRRRALEEGLGSIVRTYHVELDPEL